MISESKLVQENISVTLSCTSVQMFITILSQTCFYCVSWQLRYSLALRFGRNSSRLSPSNKRFLYALSILKWQILCNAEIWVKLGPKCFLYFRKIETAFEEERSVKYSFLFTIVRFFYASQQFPLRKNQRKVKSSHRLSISQSEKAKIQFFWLRGFRLIWKRFIEN